MSTNDLALSYPGFFESEIIDNSVILRFSGNFFHNSIDFDKKDFFSEFLKKVNDAKNIHAVILHSAYSETGENEYLKFFRREHPQRSLAHFGFSSFMNTNELNRYCNFLDQFVMELIRIEKFIIHICSGDVLTQSMNIALACDQRIIGDDTVFYNIFQDVGTIPKGGSIYFMEKRLGHAKTMELLLLQSQISAVQALEYGLADRVVVPAEIEKEAMVIVEKIRKIPRGTVAGIKRLSSRSLKDFEAYLDRETAEITRIGIKS
jgi:2-(1,2-epoxy-1,2-dihydrophenyl)acetyl-CoA isomerase